MAPRPTTNKCLRTPSSLLTLFVCVCCLSSSQRKHKDHALRSKINKMDSLGESDERGLTLTLSTQVSVGVEETSLGATVDTK